MASRRSRRSKARRSGSRKAQNRGAARWLIYGSLIVGFLLVAGLIYGYNAVRSYLRSDGFRIMLGSRAGEMLQGKGEFSPFQWDGWSVSTDDFSFAGADGVQKFTARQIEAEVDIAAIWGNAYRVENIQLREFDFTGDFRDGVVGTGEIDSWKSEPGFFSDLLPDRVEISGVDIASVRGAALTDSGDWRWGNVSAKIRPGSGKQVYDLELSGGELATPLSLVDKLSLRNAKGRYSGGQVFLLSSEFSALDDATLRAEGDFNPLNQSWQVRGDVTGARIEDIIEEDWKQKLMGPIAATFEVTGAPDQEVVIRGDLKITDGVLTALPVLNHIAAYAQSMRFRRLDLKEASLEFEKVGSKLDLRNILLFSEGLVRLEGDMRIDGQIIRKGDFEVGITPGTLAHLPGAETKVFKRGKLGYLWAPLQISGTLEAPQEDLSARLIDAAKERMFEMIPETGQYALKYGGKVMEDSTKAILDEQGIILGVGKSALDRVRDLTPGDLLNPGKGIIDTGKDVVTEGVGKVFDIFGNPIEETEVDSSKNEGSSTESGTSAPGSDQ